MSRGIVRGSCYETHMKEVYSQSCIILRKNTLLYVREDHVVAEFKQLILKGGLTLLSIEDVYQAQEFPA